MGFVLSMLGAVGGFKQLGSRIQFMLLKDGSGRRARDRLVEAGWVAGGRDRAEERVMTRVQPPAQAEPAPYTVSQVTSQAVDPPGTPGGGWSRHCPISRQARVLRLFKEGAKVRAQRSEPVLRCLRCTGPRPLPVTEFSARGFEHEPLVLAC